ncbi:hypothetical protein [Bacillus sp. AG4(2022)]|uniref:hypothetical protein n=1 Tax=Bacillus sp. AG4(2022) TaxID=2962594 RepID=UPI002882290C|nr:hypothetical protein [Bacillus sp. AG4(2022)]MDT0160652.1 hypothetical protein [Bacillus sp. AG4(2022)]
MVFRFVFQVPTDLDISRLEAYYYSLGLRGDVIVWEMEDNGEENLLGFVNMATPTKVIEIKSTDVASRLEGRIAHEITHISLTNNRFNNICYHDEPICLENKYLEFTNQFSNFLHHQVLYPKYIYNGFTLEDDIDIVQRFYMDANNIEQMVLAFQSEDRFAKAWVIISIMNDLLRLADRRDILIDIIGIHLREAIDIAEEVLNEIGIVNSLEEYLNSKSIIEQRFNLPIFELDEEKN